MRTSKSSESQILGVLRQQVAVVKVVNICCGHGMRPRRSTGRVAVLYTAA